MPHRSQLAGSRCVFTQEAPHSVVPTAHLGAHRPLEQSWPALHAVPQSPQFTGSVAVFTHAPPQALLLPGHVLASFVLASVVLASVVSASVVDVGNVAGLPPEQPPTRATPAPANRPIAAVSFSCVRQRRGSPQFIPKVRRPVATGKPSFDRALQIRLRSFLTEHVHPVELVYGTDVDPRRGPHRGRLPCRGAGVASEAASSARTHRRRLNKRGAILGLRIRGRVARPRRRVSRPRSG
jgi:hypothetical protein